MTRGVAVPGAWGNTRELGRAGTRGKTRQLAKGGLGENEKTESTKSEEERSLPGERGVGGNSKNGEPEDEEGGRC